MLFDIRMTQSRFTRTLRLSNLYQSSKRRTSRLGSAMIAGLGALLFLAPFKAMAASNSASVLSASAQRLLNECNRDKVSTALTYQLAASDPVHYSGRELLLEGNIQGTIQVGDRTTFLIGLRDGSLASLGAEDGSSYSEFTSGRQVCVLAQAPAGWSPSMSLEIVDMISTYDAEPVLAQLAPASKPAPRAAPNHAADRELYSEALTPSRSFDANTGPQRYLLKQYAGAVHWFNPHLKQDRAMEIAGDVLWYSEANGVDPRLVMAVIGAESDFHLKSTSSKGAMGLAQLMPGTAKDLGVTNAYDPQQNISGAVRLIRWHLLQNANSDDPLALALASYNAGENAVKKHHGVPPFKETIQYIQKVKWLYAKMCRGDRQP